MSRKSDDLPTECSPDDIDKFMDIIINQEIKSRNCWKCGNEYLPNFADFLCD